MNRRRMMGNRYHVDGKGEITDDWETIIENINAGNEKKFYKPGSYKPLVVDGVTYRAELAGFATDTDWQTSEVLATAWIFKELSAKSRVYNYDSSSDISSYRRYDSSYANTFYRKIPSPVKGAIKGTRKNIYDTTVQVHGSQTCTVHTDIGREFIWVPSAKELEDGIYTVKAGNPNSMAKTVAGTNEVHKYPLRSLGADANQNACFDMVDENGNLLKATGYGGASHQCFGFCI